MQVSFCRYGQIWNLRDHWCYAFVLCVGFLALPEKYHDHRTENFFKVCQSMSHISFILPKHSVLLHSAPCFTSLRPLPCCWTPPPHKITAKLHLFNLGFYLEWHVGRCSVRSWGSDRRGGTCWITQAASRRLWMICNRTATLSSLANPVVWNQSQPGHLLKIRRQVVSLSGHICEQSDYFTMPSTYLLPLKPVTLFRA